MTNEKAIEVIRSECYVANLLDIDRTVLVNTALDTAIKALEQTRWIPVSEKLPEKNGEYLITGRQGAVNKRRYHDGYWYGNWSVIAWMPLPEPYKEE